MKSGVILEFTAGWTAQAAPAPQAAARSDTAPAQHAPGAGSFGGIAGGLGGAVSRLGKLGILGATGYAAYAATDWIADKTGLHSFIGRKLEGDTYDPNAHSRSASINVHVHNKVDGKGITTMVNQEQYKAFARPQTGIAGFDPLQTLIPAGGI